MKTENKTSVKKINPVLILLGLPFLTVLIGVVLLFIVSLVPFATLYFVVNRISQVSEERAQISAKKELHKDKNYLTYLYKLKKENIHNQPKKSEASGLNLASVLSAFKQN
ncbi:hypothetical protein [Leeuwenhoekiella marinoflava]|uniref:hypothetical protein n=1 Tax=Leeuwenhoekiella marinoflava TaxID=988 RepID=UPI0030021F73